MSSKCLWIDVDSKELKKETMGQFEDYAAFVTMRQHPSMHDVVKAFKEQAPNVCEVIATSPPRPLGLLVRYTKSLPDDSKALACRFPYPIFFARIDSNVYESPQPLPASPHALVSIPPRIWLKGFIIQTKIWQNHHLIPSFGVTYTKQILSPLQCFHWTRIHFYICSRIISFALLRVFWWG